MNAQILDPCLYRSVEDKTYQGRDSSELQIIANLKIALQKTRIPHNEIPNIPLLHNPHECNDRDQREVGREETGSQDRYHCHWHCLEKTDEPYLLASPVS